MFIPLLQKDLLFVFVGTCKLFHGSRTYLGAIHPLLVPTFRCTASVHTFEYTHNRLSSLTIIHSDLRFGWYRGTTMNSESYCLGTFRRSDFISAAPTPIHPGQRRAKTSGSQLPNRTSSFCELCAVSFDCPVVLFVCILSQPHYPLLVCPYF